MDPWYQKTKELDEINSLSLINKSNIIKSWLNKHAKEAGLFLMTESCKTIYRVKTSKPFLFRQTSNYVLPFRVRKNKHSFKTLI